MLYAKDVYIGRAGKGMSGYFGNPFSDGTREENIKRFEEYARNRMSTDQAFKNAVKALIGKRLFCFCNPFPCHGDILIKLTEELNNAFKQ